MKTLKFLFAITITTICATTVASCSKDGDEPSTPVARSIAGEYTGDLECSVMGSVETFAHLTYQIIAEDDTHVTVILPAFGAAPMALPSITANNLAVTEVNGLATIPTTEVTGTTDTGRNYTCTLTGTVENKKLNMRFNLQYGAMPMPLICSVVATLE